MSHDRCRETRHVSRTAMHAESMRVLATRSLLLEPLLVAHAGEMFEVLGDPAIYEFENGPPQSEHALIDRYAMLEHRLSPDGGQGWLNWVIRLPDGALAGYVQATVHPSGTAYVAYELASRHWRQGIGNAAVAAMLTELRLNYAVHRYIAVLKARNHRSLGLLHKLRFVAVSEAESIEFGAGGDEVAMRKEARQ